MSEAKVVKKVRLSDGAWALTLRIDNDPATDTVHTLYAHNIDCTPEAVAAWLAGRKAHILEKHHKSSVLDMLLPDME